MVNEDKYKFCAPIAKLAATHRIAMGANYSLCYAAEPTFVSTFLRQTTQTSSFKKTRLFKYFFEVVNNTQLSRRREKYREKTITLSVAGTAQAVADGVLTNKAIGRLTAFSDVIRVTVQPAWSA